MNTSIEKLAKPLLVAGTEVRAESSNFGEVLADREQEFHIAPAAASPPGYHWFDIYVDAQRGERRAAATAHTILSALVEGSTKGWIEDFRILFGKQYLQVGETLASESHPSQFGDMRVAT
jgi:hypothetical protein